MKIRKARKSDFNELAEILIEESSKKPYNEKYTIKEALKEINDFSKKELYIAQNEKEVIGFIASSVTSNIGKRAYIQELWLRPKYQGKGIGKELVKTIERIYKKKRIKIIRLVAHKDSKAFNFYKKLKYSEYKKLVFMEKKLK